MGQPVPHSRLGYGNGTGGHPPPPGLQAGAQSADPVGGRPCVRWGAPYRAAVPRQPVGAQRQRLRRRRPIAPGGRVPATTAVRLLLLRLRPFRDAPRRRGRPQLAPRPRPPAPPPGSLPAARRAPRAPRTGGAGPGAASPAQGSPDRAAALAGRASAGVRAAWERRGVSGNGAVGVAGRWTEADGQPRPGSPRTRLWSGPPCHRGSCRPAAWRERWPGELAAEVGGCLMRTRICFGAGP